MKAEVTEAQFMVSVITVDVILLSTYLPLPIVESNFISTQQTHKLNDMRNLYIHYT